MKTKRVLILVLIISMACSCLNTAQTAKAAEGKKSLKINNTTLIFDEIIYVDAAGDDTAGDGTKEMPYKTLKKAAEQITVPEYAYCIKLGNGEYEQGKWIRNTICTNEITIIGNGKNTRLITTEAFCPNPATATDNCQCSFKYIDFIWDDTGEGSKTNRHGLTKDVLFSNILFDLSVLKYNYAYFYAYTKIQMVNCTMTSQVIDFFKPYAGEIKVTNSYGPFIAGESIEQSVWDYQTNLIVTESKLDADYNITDNGWKNTGTGSNPDGSKANIGVYGGEFAWGASSSEPQQSQLKAVLEPKETLQLSVDEDLEVNGDMNWSSSNKEVVTVDSSGLVTALKKGSATVTVTSKDGSYTDSIQILVVDDASELRLAMDMKAGTSRRVTIDDLTDTKKVTWTSMDTDIAEIDAREK